MFRLLTPRSARHPAVLLLLALLFGWQSLASAMALPCRFQARPASGSTALHASHESASHAEHCVGMKQQAKAHDCDGLCADHHCAGVALALQPTFASSTGPALARIDAPFRSEPPRSGSPNELIRPPSRS
jgi:hypothetical protein